VHAPRKCVLELRYRTRLSGREPESDLDGLWFADNLARTITDRNAAEAAAFTDRLPPEFRGSWIREVAARYASQDPDGAASWIIQFPGRARLRGHARTASTAVRDGSIPQAAQRWAAALPRGEIRDQAPARCSAGSQIPHSGGSWKIRSSGRKAGTSFDSICALLKIVDQTSCSKAAAQLTIRRNKLL
jgi:hypothetical protein